MRLETMIRMFALSSAMFASLWVGAAVLMPKESAVEWTLRAGMAFGAFAAFGAIVAALFGLFQAFQARRVRLAVLAVRSELQIAAERSKWVLRETAQVLVAQLDDIVMIVPRIALTPELDAEFRGLRPEEADRKTAAQ